MDVMRNCRWFIVLIVLASLAGCATPHQLILHDGSTILTKDEPDFDDDTGFYEIERESGEKMKINKDEIKVIRKL